VAATSGAAQPGLAPDCLQPSRLRRCGFRARLSASVRRMRPRHISTGKREEAMDQDTSGGLRRPPMDDRPLWDVVLGLYGYPAVLLAHKLKLFPLLATRPRTLADICDGLHLARRPAAALVSAATALGFLQLHDGRYRLTPPGGTVSARQQPHLLRRGAGLDDCESRGLVAGELRERRAHR
jgi:hypothetical protein